MMFITVVLVSWRNKVILIWTFIEAWPHEKIGYFGDVVVGGCRLQRFITVTR